MNWDMICFMALRFRVLHVTDEIRRIDMQVMTVVVVCVAMFAILSVIAKCQYGITRSISYSAIPRNVSVPSSDRPLTTVINELKHSSDADCVQSEVFEFCAHESRTPFAAL